MQQQGKGLADLRSPLAGSKSLHASLNRGIDQLLLGRGIGVLRVGDEGEHGVNTLQDSSQLLDILVAGLGPLHSRGEFRGGSILKD